MNKALIAAFIGLDNSHFGARPGHHRHERFDRVSGIWQIMLINDTCHLRGLERGAYVDF